MEKQEFFPDGTPIDEWFYKTDIPNLSELGKQYVLTDYGVLDDGKIYTAEIQRLIDVASVNGGVIIVPQGVYRTGALFFKQGVSLYVAENGVLQGSDEITDYPVLKTRIEGETCDYFAALINADGIDGFKMLGKGVIDGNGFRSWKAFWLRRKWNPQCTNKDEQRARLVYISNCKNVLVAGLRFQNSQFWTNHLYKCSRVKYVGCDISSPTGPEGAPSTDAIDVDVCTDVLIKNCKISVNDDAIALKGGKGPWADALPENGANERIIIEDCEFGVCHACLTCGSESVHNKNILLRRIKAVAAMKALWLKIRPDTPQKYEYITVEDVRGEIKDFIYISSWTQFFDLQGRKDAPLSYAEHITVRNCECKCETYFDVQAEPSQYVLSGFVFENLKIAALNNGFTENFIDGVTVKNTVVKIVRK